MSEQLDAASKTNAESDPSQEVLYEVFDVKHRISFDPAAIIEGVAGAALDVALGTGKVLGQAAADGLASYTPEEEHAMQLYRRAQKPQ